MLGEHQRGALHAQVEGVGQVPAAVDGLQDPAYGADGDEPVQLGAGQAEVGDLAQVERSVR